MTNEEICLGLELIASSGSIYICRTSFDSEYKMDERFYDRIAPGEHKIRTPLSLALYVYEEHIQKIARKYHKLKRTGNLTFQDLCRLIKDNNPIELELLMMFIMDDYVDKSSRVLYFQEIENKPKLIHSSKIVDIRAQNEDCLLKIRRKLQDKKLLNGFS